MTLLDEIRNYSPYNAQEEKDRAQLLWWLESGIPLYHRESAAHLTASAWVVTPDRQRVLMAYHRLYDSWAWTGGHADGETDLCAVAKREAEEETSDLLLDEILSNEDCFKGITNLGEILGQMIDLYANNLDNEVFISSAGFAIKLEDEVEMPYLGRAKLVLTNKSILNRDVGFSEEEKFEAKKKCINTFLGIYLKPNFGVIFENNKELNEKLRRFNLEVVKRGLRDRSITTTAYRCNQYIQNVALLSNSQNDIIVS